MNGKAHSVKPVIKWAGGKTQLLDTIDSFLPQEVKNGEISRYIEPFVGGGAVFAYFINNYNLKSSYIGDINKVLIITYQVIKNSLQSLIDELRELERLYYTSNNEQRKILFYDIRSNFNLQKREIDNRKIQESWIKIAADFIFLNRTCYNGLFRVNNKGEFNVPFSYYDKPNILNEKNLKDFSSLIKNTTLISGDFTKCQKYINKNSFIYLDPPYRPISYTSSFASYSNFGFSDADHKRLWSFFKKADKKGAKVMLCNSDPSELMPNDTYIEDLYSEYLIKRITARRSINCMGMKRGDISELIITNYDENSPKK